MYGAILGDIIGSPFEFDRGDKTKNFDLFSEGCGFTDDSVMTIAVGEALMAVGPKAAVKEIEEAVASNMQDWGKRYPHAGYGGSFRHWLKENNPKPYGSYGNGSAMRVSAAGWLYDSIERTREVARATANVTHNHPEGIKGAEATASAIYMARNGSSKEEIKTYIEREFHYDLSRTLDNIRTYYHHVESCQETVPEAIIAFLESKDFEDAIRNAVSLGGDTDTLGAITGSIAEAFYGIPAVLIAECKSRIDKGLMTDVLDEFDHAHDIFTFEDFQFLREISYMPKDKICLVTCSRKPLNDIEKKAPDDKLSVFAQTFKTCPIGMYEEQNLIYYWDQSANFWEVKDSNKSFEKYPTSLKIPKIIIITPVAIPITEMENEG